MAARKSRVDTVNENSVDETMTDRINEVKIEKGVVSEIARGRDQKLRMSC